LFVLPLKWVYILFHWATNTLSIMNILFLFVHFSDLLYFFLCEFVNLIFHAVTPWSRKILFKLYHLDMLLLIELFLFRNLIIIHILSQFHRHSLYILFYLIMIWLLIMIYTNFTNIIGQILIKSPLFLLKNLSFKHLKLHPNSTSCTVDFNRVILFRNT
jgi:hypothetical protein